LDRGSTGMICALATLILAAQQAWNRMTHSLEDLDQ